MSAKKRSMLEKIIPYVLSVGMLSLVASCGSDDDDDSDSPPAREDVLNVTYRAVLIPVNNSGATGTATINREADQFNVDIAMTGAPSTVHMQHIRSGTACATAASDSNKDGFVDALEAQAVSGPVLIPLDSDLVSREAGGTYPSGSTYSYQESTSFMAMAADLATISAGRVGLQNRVIEIYGTTAALPATVAGAQDLSPAQSLPIACGVLVVIPSED